jgi:hypothetical protein
LKATKRREAEDEAQATRQDDLNDAVMITLVRANITALHRFNINHSTQSAESNRFARQIHILHHKPSFERMQDDLDLLPKRDHILPNLSKRFSDFKRNGNG